MAEEFHHSSYTISDDRARLDLEVIHGFLIECYWAAGIPRDVVARSIEHSLCFGVYQRDRQIGFARVITDHATYGYLADVFILESHRGRGIGKWLMECIMKHPQLQGLRRWGLVTRDAHELYRASGFTELKNPERHMEIYNSGIYGVKKNSAK